MHSHSLAINPVAVKPAASNHTTPAPPHSSQAAMSESNTPQYSEHIQCDVSEEEELIFIKVVAMPHLDPVEFNAAEARAFAEKILDSVRHIEDK
jgi:hypothetical protein